MNSTKIRKAGGFILLLTTSVTAVAQEATEAAVTAPTGGALGLDRFSSMELLLLGLIGTILLLGAASIIKLSFSLLEMQKLRVLEKYSPEQLQEIGVANVVSTEPWWKEMYKKWTNVVPVEKEQDIMLDHDYDGIHELDNSLPPWWLAIFYVTTAFAVFYIGYQHFSDYGTSSQEAYVMEMEEAEASVKAFLATQANAVDETNVVMLDDPEAIGRGEMTYIAKCAVCHGQLGEGGIGPNLTDQYWLHGGSIADVFKTVKYGVPEKGMVPWKNDLRPAQIQEVASFIKTLVGTNPPNPKEAQGEIYVDDPAETTEEPSEESLSMNE
ncbi:cbb3-type cytochrome c oxidase N-terminal domain-containing protein [Lewinella sp. W8]|uniref:cbb3-type cytochrome c oxidase N-terminal domain-containing protein n=1 Tax=Lewinella sp. W8 TaxID=2528208 RepID=UPI0010679E5A|nr:cbb3-type cytochrome c oxidase N-terminal domain-containing protein [Lewinella sp. W8]MTB51834.1 c-type cytochrome [Lewinella sp. W8]